MILRPECQWQLVEYMELSPYYILILYMVITNWKINIFHDGSV